MGAQVHRFRGTCRFAVTKRADRNGAVTNMRFRARVVLVPVLFLAGFAPAFAVAYRDRSNPQEVASSAVVVTETEPVDETIVDTSVPLILEDTVAETTLATTPPTTEPPPPETTVPETVAPEPDRPTPQRTTDGAVLVPIGGVDRRLFDPSNECNSLSISGTANACERRAIGDNDVAWVEDTNGGLDLLARELGTDDVYDVQLRSTSTAVGVRFVDATGDGSEDIVAGWRDSNGVLAVDIVEFRDGQWVVTLHLTLTGGRASIGNGQIEAWNGVPLPGEDPSDPSTYDRWTYTKEGGSWVVESARDDNPPSGEF